MRELRPRSPFEKVPNQHLEEWVRMSSKHPTVLAADVVLYGLMTPAPGARNFDTFGFLIFLADRRTSVRVASFSEASDWWRRLGYGTLLKTTWLDFQNDTFIAKSEGGWREVCLEWFGVDPREVENAE